MARFKWYDGNQGFHRYHSFRDYNVASQDLNGATLNYNPASGGAFDETRYAWRIELSFAGAAQHTFQEGPNAGQTIFTNGAIDEVRYYNDSGDLILRISDLNVDLSVISAFYVQDDIDLNRLWDLIVQQGGTFIGSSDGSGPSQDWDGDEIQTGYGNDTVKSNGGDDYISDLLGKDKYNGGDGWDTLSYTDLFWNPHLVKQGIRVDLSNNKIVGADGKTDTVKNIEEIRGTFKKDVFKGDSEDNRFFGMQGKDVIDGKGGFDVASYRNDDRYGGTDGIIANLKEGFVRDGFGHKDKLKSIEGVEGTDQDDVFIDNKKDNYFRLRDGDDTVTLSKGNDYVDARGDGADLFIFKGNNFGHDEIEAFDDGDGDEIQILNATGMGDLMISQDGDDALIEFGDSSIRLLDFDSGDLDPSDFIFSAPA